MYFYFTQSLGNFPIPLATKQKNLIEQSIRRLYKKYILVLYKTQTILLKCNLKNSLKMARQGVL